MDAESMIIGKIRNAFTVDDSVDDEWIKSNPYIFEEMDAEEAIKYLPSFMIYVLNTFRNNSQSDVYIQLLSAFNEFSKCKNSEIKHLNLWFVISAEQRRVILAFLGHLLKNQPANIDEEELSNIIKRWQRIA